MFTLPLRHMYSTGYMWSVMLIASPWYTSAPSAMMYNLSLWYLHSTCVLLFTAYSSVIICTYVLLVCSDHLTLFRVAQLYVSFPLNPYNPQQTLYFFLNRRVASSRQLQSPCQQHRRGGQNENGKPTTTAGIIYFADMITVPLWRSS